MLIDCESCEMRDLACDDCVVTVLLGPTRTAGAAPALAGVVTLDEGEELALAVLADSGLVPPLRLVRSAGSDVGPDRPGPDTRVG